MDDILVFGETSQSHDTALESVKKCLAEAGVTLNEQKCHYRQKSIRYLGHVISADGIQPDPSKLEAIQALPEPSSVPELRRVLGLFNYIGKFLPNMAAVSAPLRVLLKTDNSWCWEPSQAEAFAKLKSMAMSAPSLALFNPKLPVRISADASSYGLGAVLLQPHANLFKAARIEMKISSTAQVSAQLVQVRSSAR